MQDELTSLGYSLESDVSYMLGSTEPRQALDIYRPLSATSDRLPVVVYFHGGAWEFGSKEAGFERISQVFDTGFIFISVAYRLIGEATWPAQIDDCVVALKFIQENVEGVDLSNIAIWGSSAGAHLGCLLAGGCRVDHPVGVKCVVDYCAPVTVDLFVDQLTGCERESSAVMRLLGGDHSQTSVMAKEATVTRWVKSGYPRTLIVHGDKDDVVPLLQSQVLEQAIAAVGSKVELYIAKDGSHRVDSEVVTDKVREFLLENLGV